MGARGGTNPGGRSRRQTLGASLFDSLEQHSSAHYLGGQKSEISRAEPRRHSGGQANDTFQSSRRTTTALGARQDKACLNLDNDEVHSTEPNHPLNDLTEHHTTTAAPTPHQWRSPRLPGYQYPDSIQRNHLPLTPRSRRHTRLPPDQQYRSRPPTTTDWPPASNNTTRTNNDDTLAPNYSVLSPSHRAHETHPATGRATRLTHECPPHEANH